MGWMYTYKSPKEKPCVFLKHRLEVDNANGTGKFLACSVVRFRTAYIAYEIKRPDGERKVIAVVVSLDYKPKDPGGYNFGYKDMDESVGPVEAECPRRILDLLTPTDHPYALRWRERCRANIAARATLPRFKVGDRVEFETPVTFTDGQSLTHMEVASTKPLRFSHGNMLYRVRRASLIHHKPKVMGA